MTSEQKINFKKRLYQRAVELIEDRIFTGNMAMQQAQTAANEQEKSSAGDKYETSRAMNHLEKDMHARQVEENKKELAFLLSIDCEKICNTAMAGSFVDCGDIFFFIAAGTGKIYFEGSSGYMLSPNAPLAKILYHKKKGDIIQFNKTDICILAVF